ncbi:MAG: PKD domain-containing protein [Cyclobacteriaceae bacterium]
MKAKILCIAVLLFTTGLNVLGQLPVADFSLTGTQFCLGETLVITNDSQNATEYDWDYCLEGFYQEPQEFLNLIPAGLGQAWGIEIVEDNGQWYGFVLARNPAAIIRLDFGDSPTNSPTPVSLGNPDAELSFAEGLSLINENGNWYLFIGYLNFNKGIVRLDFGTSLTNATPVVNNLGDFGLTTRVRDIEALYTGSEYVLVFSDLINDAIVRVDYGSSFTNSITGGDIYQSAAIANLSFATGFDVLLIGDEYKLFMVSDSDDKLVQLDFSTDIFSSLTEEDAYTITGLSSARKVRIGVEGENYYGIIAAENTTTRLFDLDDLNNSGSISEIIPAATLPEGEGIEIVRYQGRNLVFTSDHNTIRGNEFERNCGVSLAFSENFSDQITYASSGQKIISLSVSNGQNVHSMADTITILNQTAPLISFTTDFACISTPNTFTPSLLGLSYTWDFGDGSMPVYVNDEVPTHQYSLPGTYTVRLDVNDGTCNNFTEQEITIYPDLPTPTFTAPANECKNTEILFTSTTDSSQHLGVLTYEWDFNGEGASTDQDPTFTFATPGTKQITLKTLIPGCENTSSIFDIDIADGPTSAFNPSSFSICEGETISFTDASTNGPISWSWDFDDGFTSTAQNPNHLFSTAGSHDVALTVTDALGCENILVQEVSVSALPEVSFDFNVPCTSADGILFMDMSTVSGGSIVSRTWYIGDAPLAEAQNQQNPLLSFAAEGTVNVRLVTVSSSGCEASHSEDIQILASPQPEFSMNIGCQGEESVFTDLSVSPGNQVTSWLWRLDGMEYATEDINHTFSGAGMFDVTLEVTGQNFCSETITKSIEVLELLTVDFDVNGDCSNELVELSDQSLALQDPIVSRAWSLDGTSVGNGAELVLESLPDNTYEVMLEVTTASGCVVNTTSSIVINQSPESSISAQKTFGVPGDAITFTNQSTGGSAYHWLFNGVSVSDNANEETFTFPDPGTYQVSMVSDNDLGCSDTTSTSVLIAVPSVDLSVGQFEIVGSGNVGTIFLEIQNNSNLPIDNTEVSVELENQFAITEQITSVIGVGESELINLSIGVPLNVDQLSYLCVAVNSQYKGFDDNNPLDNEKCVAIQPKIVIEAPFPNPVRDQVRVRVVTPEVGAATLTLLNSAGKVEIARSVQTQEGLNNFFLDLKALTTGIYFIRVQTGETTSVQRIIKL